VNHGLVRRPLFVLTILVGSFLLFLIQPMVARMALPMLGGAPNVWNSAMLVYQALLLAGYAYTHRLARMPLRRQATIHVALLLLAGVTLPVGLAELPPPSPGWEVLWVPLLLAISVGPVFFLVSAQAPLMQRWFASDADAGEPWALYAASNLGSFAGLVAYPLLAEPLLPIRGQSLAWSAGYLVLIVLVALSARARWHAPQAVEPQAPDVVADKVPARRVLLWLLLSAVPSGLMLSTTTHLTTDIFAMPLLWVIPLGLYLLSFVVAFADNRVIAWAIGMLAPVTMMIAGSIAMVSRNSGTMLFALASVLLLFVVAVVLHSRLYDLRPAPSRLTFFYLVNSIGGALGGAFTALVAPVVFDWVWEHPLLVIAAALLMPLPTLYDWRRMPGLDPVVARIGSGVLLAAAAVLAFCLVDVTSVDEPGAPRIWLTLALTVVGLLLTPWRGLFVAALVLAMLGQGGLETINRTIEHSRVRSYFGIYTVRDHPSVRIRTLAHGTTLHGQQSTDPARAHEPMTYYGRESGVGLAMAQAPALFGPHTRIGVVGLGTGTLACYRRPGQRWTFFEIDPAVLRLSQDRTFTYLSDCAPDSRVALGDARLVLGRTPPGSLDLLAIDAFSSDAIPLHLLTDEAFTTYTRTLSRDGVLLVHISNRFIELEPVLAAAARERRLAAMLRDDNPPEGIYLTGSTWVAMARDRALLERLAQARPDAPWRPLKPAAPRAWTDDHASILPYIHWQTTLRTE